MVKFSLQVGQKGRKRFTLGIAITSSAYHTRARGLAILAIGAAAYLLAAIAADVWVVSAPDGNRYIHFGILTVLGLAFMTAAEGFLALIRAISQADMLAWPFRAAAIGSLAYTLAWARPVFVNYWYYDDWGYLRGAPSALAYMLEPLNDHFVPLLKLVILAMTRVFGFDYIGAACLQQAAFLMIVLVLAHLLWSVVRRPWLLVVLVGLFAMWPSYGVARTWFAGGFWLTASAAFLSVYILHARRIVLDGRVRWWDLAVSFVLASATIFISSQTLAPVVYLAAFCLPPLLLSSRRSIDLQRLAMLAAVSLAPTILALWGRNVYAGTTRLNPAGLWDGSVFINLGAFFLNKVLFVQSFRNWRSPVELVVLLLFPVAAAVKKLATSKIIPPDRKANLASLILGGGAVFVLSIVQIGLGRRWSYDAALNPYYVTLPLLGLWLMWLASGLTLLGGGDDAVNPGFSRSVAIVTAVLMAAAVLSPALQQNGVSMKRRIRIVDTERLFMDRLGAAVCDLARLHRNGSAARWAPGPDLRSCEVCRRIIGPPRFLQGVGFSLLSDIAARRSCPADAADSPPGTQVTDGSESAAARSFLRTYFGPFAGLP